MHLRFRQSVWAVGQGGFTMGSLYQEGVCVKRLYTYVYDCGSDQLNALRSELDAAQSHFSEEADVWIDTVFISHLDADHVNGFDTLCETFDHRIGRVVLPYLDLVSRYYLAASAMANRTATGLLLEFLIDPIAWVRARLPNANIILLGGGSEPADDLVDPDVPRHDPDSGSVRQARLNTTVLELIRLDPSPGDTDKAEYPQYRWIEIEPTPSKANASPLLLLAHIPPRSDRKLAQFKAALKKQGFDRLGKKNLMAILRKKETREALRTCYLELASDHNIVSIHLLVKPLLPLRAPYATGKSGATMYHHVFHSSGKIGFLFSGDANLGIKKYFNCWKAFYHAYLDDVGVFSLPHHGSKLGFDIRLLDALQNARFIAQSGSNGHGHPDPGIVRQLEGAGRANQQVSENASTRLDVTFHI
jgi:hypothetical protein